LTYLEHA